MKVRLLVPVLAATLACLAGALPVSAAPITPAPPVRPDETRVIGYSRQGRPIVAERYGIGPTVVLAGGSIHGNEKSGQNIISQIATPQSGYTLWVIRQMNPDGYAAGKLLKSGDTVGTRGNAAGVNLNRNFDAGWRKLTGTEIYSGPAAASEPETKALQAFFLTVQPALAVFYHSEANAVGNNRDRSKVPSAINLYAQVAKLPVVDFGCGGPCTGTATRYLYEKVARSTSFVVELPIDANTLPATTVARHRDAFWAAAAEVKAKLR